MTDYHGDVYPALGQFIGIGFVRCVGKEFHWMLFQKSGVRKTPPLQTKIQLDFQWDSVDDETDRGVSVTLHL